MIVLAAVNLEVISPHGVHLNAVIVVIVVGGQKCLGLTEIPEHMLKGRRITGMPNHSLPYTPAAEFICAPFCSPPVTCNRKSPSHPALRIQTYQ
jgi:hypothetical protein